MFVKAGIVAAVAAASLVAVSPLAFAGDYGDNGHKSHHKSHHHGDNDDNDYRDHDGDHDRGDHRGHYRHASSDSDNCNGDVNQVNSGDSRGLVNVSGVNAAVPVNVCNDDILSGVLGVLSSGLTNVGR